VVAALESSARQLSAETERLSKSAGAISSTLDGVSTSLAAMQTPDKVIELKIDPVVQALTGVALELRQHFGDHATQMATLLERANSATEASAAAVNALQSESRATEDRLRETLNETTNLAKTMVMAVANFKVESAKQADQINQSLEAALNSFERAARSIEANSSQFGTDPETPRSSTPLAERLVSAGEIPPSRKSWWPK
jgi:hypothetical protein